MAAKAPDALERAGRVRVMIFDVDGVLTDGRLWYGPAGEALKAFNVLDGHGIKMLRSSGVEVALLSGRNSPAVTVRAAELGIRHVLQGIDDKAAAFAGLLAGLGLSADQAGFMGDELVDLPVLRRSAFACAPGGAHALVLCHVHYIASAAAGAGAAREVCEYLMQAQGTLDAALATWLA
ncbi:MAG: phenylphosphate carboxylase subunit delta [Betaproteobacteria bacterium]|nr:phenylphosphate carboxylase subunit delta [Betaproteobacteria bacterium]